MGECIHFNINVKHIKKNSKTPGVPEGTSENNLHPFELNAYQLAYLCASIWARSVFVDVQMRLLDNHTERVNFFSWKPYT